MQAQAPQDPNINLPESLPATQNLRLAPHPISHIPPLVTDNDREHRPDRVTNQSSIFARHIPRTRMPSINEEYDHDITRMKCCCGRPDCAYLEHNNAALGGLEKDLETAARLGQRTRTRLTKDMATSSPTLSSKRLSRLSHSSNEDSGLTFALQALLSRHESYINESQAERTRMSTCISDLETERTSLQTANEKIVAENRELLQQLEQLNKSLVDSDDDVKRLETLLLDCELEVKRLNGLVRRTEELDSRVQEMERERQLLNKQMEEGRDETRSTLSRWRDSERRIRELEEDVQRIEWEARLDKEKHEELVARLEKERSLERELGGAEGRLKGAAAVQSIGKNGGDSKNVVSHFVRDILQDNASLQAGIAELRQLLQSSNEEVQNLREQVLLHQPVQEGEDVTSQPQRTLSLEQELQSDATNSTQVQQEVHVHHHYHAKLAKARMTAPRKPIKRKVAMPGYNSISDSSAPTTPVSRPQRYASSPIIPLNLQQPHQQKNRWSMQSTATASTVLSSIPSSPRSYFDRGYYNFDRIEQGEESSRPTSPESMNELLSPGPVQWRYKRDRGNLDACEEEEVEKEAFNMSPLVESKPVFDVNELPTPSDYEPSQLEQEATPRPIIITQPSTIQVEVTVEDQFLDRPPDDDNVEKEPAAIPETPLLKRQKSHAILENLPEIRPSLARKGSHETLVSISGMDIHIAQRASPTTTLELLHSHFAHRPAQTRKASATQPLASVTEYTATSTPMSANRYQPQTLRQTPSSIEALSGIAVPRPRVIKTSSQPGAIGRFGGWVRGKWGVAPMKSTGNLRAVSLGHDTVSVESGGTPGRTEYSEGISNDTVSDGSRSISVLSTESSNSQPAKFDPANFFAGRPPGVNQAGSIPGFRAALMSRRTPSQVMVSVIDEEGLKEGLAE